jgi:hypothetical protein
VTQRWSAVRRGCDRRRKPESNHRRGTWIQIAAGHAALRCPEEVFTSLSKEHRPEGIRALLPCSGAFTAAAGCRPLDNPLFTWLPCGVSRQTQRLRLGVTNRTRRIEHD